MSLRTWFPKRFGFHVAVCGVVMVGCSGSSAAEASRTPAATTRAPAATQVPLTPAARSFAVAQIVEASQPQTVRVLFDGEPRDGKPVYTGCTEQSERTWSCVTGRASSVRTVRSMHPVGWTHVRIDGKNRLRFRGNSNLGLGLAFGQSAPVRLANLVRLDGVPPKGRRGPLTFYYASLETLKRVYDVNRLHDGTQSRWYTFWSNATY
jgi:hypothetical protein